MEMIVDEMLAILNDRDAYVQKQIEKNRRTDLDDLFIRGFDIRWNEELQDSYVYQIPAIANIDHFEFKSNITFFVGENGSGKSTFDKTLKLYSLMTTKPEEVEARKQKEMEE